MSVKTETMYPKRKYMLLLISMMFLVIFMVGMHPITALAGKGSVTLVKSSNGMIAYGSDGKTYYKGSYNRATFYLPFQSDWSTSEIQTALINFGPNTNTATGNMMSTAGFKYQGNNNIKYYRHEPVVNSNEVYSPGRITLTDGANVEFRYMGYITDGTVVGNPYFLMDTVKAGNDSKFSSYALKYVNGASGVSYRIPNVDYDGVLPNIDKLNTTGNNIVLGGVSTKYNKDSSLAQKTFNIWFNETKIGRNYRAYAVRKGYSESTAWQYWNQYLEIDGNIDEGSVNLYYTMGKGSCYLEAFVPSEGIRNTVAYEIQVYDNANRRVGYAKRENTSYMYADSVSQQDYVELYTGVKYKVKVKLKFLVRSSMDDLWSYTKQQQSTLKVYYGDNIYTLNADADNIQKLTNTDGQIKATNYQTLSSVGGAYWVTTEFETMYTVPRKTTAEVGAFDLIVPGAYQENGDNYEILDDSLLLKFNIIDRMDMMFTDYNVAAGRRWQEGDTAQKERVWIEDINGNKIDMYRRNEAFYICYAYEQCAGSEEIVGPSLDALIYRAASASTPKGTLSFEGTLTKDVTIDVDSDPVIYKQLVVVEYKPTQTKDTVIPKDAYRIENTPYLNVYAKISDKHTVEEQNNYWVTEDDTCAGKIGKCVMFPAEPADMQLNKVVFTDSNDLVLREDYSSTSALPDEKDTEGYYDREETVKIDYEVQQIVSANINIPNPRIVRIIYQGKKNSDGTVSKYLDEQGKPVVLRSQGVVMSMETLWPEELTGDDFPGNKNKVNATEYISTTAEALYIEYAIADKHYLQRENDILDSWSHMVEENAPYIATISCTVADLAVEKDITLYDSKGIPSQNIPNLSESLTFGFNILHMGNTKEQMMAVGGSRFNPYVTLNVKVIDNDKAGVAVTSYDQIPANSDAIIGTATVTADTILYPGRAGAWIPKVQVKVPDVQTTVGNITVCGQVAFAHDANLSNIVRDSNDEYCQVFKMERDLSITDISYVPTKSVTGKTELGFSVTVNNMGSSYNDDNVILQPIMSVYNYNYQTGEWDRIYRSQINVAQGEWVVTEINIPDFDISDNPMKPTRLRVAVNDKMTTSEWKYQEYVLKDTDADLNADPYRNNYKEVTVKYTAPDLTICPECTVH